MTLDSNAQIMHLPSTVIDGDTVPIMWLKPVDVYSTRVFKNRRAEIKYNRLVYNVSKAYPFAIEAKSRLDLLQKNLEGIKETDPVKRKKIAKVFEKELKKEFTDDLKKLTVSQGRLLIKLIDRETSHTTYELIYDYRGKASAFFWQSFASIFGTSLKMEYNSKEEQEIENIIYWLKATGRV